MEKALFPYIYGIYGEACDQHHMGASHHITIIINLVITASSAAKAGLMGIHPDITMSQMHSRIHNLLE